MKARFPPSCRAAFRPQTAAEPPPAPRYISAAPTAPGEAVRPAASRRPATAGAPRHPAGKGGRDAPDRRGRPPLAPLLRRPPAAPRPHAHGERRRAPLPPGWQLAAGPQGAPGPEGRAAGGAGEANGRRPRGPALLDRPPAPPALPHSQVAASARATATARPASSGRHRPHRRLIATGGRSGPGAAP